MKRPCLRTLDRPIVALWGLEPSDLGAVLGVVGALLVLTNIGVALVGGVSVCLGLKALKAGKPKGYVFALFYRSGLIRFMPARLRPPYLILPPSIARRPLRFSGIPSPLDDQSAEARFFRGPREFWR